MYNDCRKYQSVIHTFYFTLWIVNHFYVTVTHNRKYYFILVKSYFKGEVVNIKYLPL